MYKCLCVKYKMNQKNMRHRRSNKLLASIHNMRCTMELHVLVVQSSSFTTLFKTKIFSSLL